jgi:raffinose/stachyose/melibiose transport system permease protein
MTNLSQSSFESPVATLPQAHVAEDALQFREKKQRGGIALTIVLAVVAIMWIAPLALLVTTAIRPLSDFVGNGPLSWPREFTWSNFTDAWTSATSGRPTATASSSP